MVKRLYRSSWRSLLLILFATVLISCVDGADFGWSSPLRFRSPPALAAAAGAYNSSLGEAILFGGTNDRTWLDETWRWDGESWSRLRPDTAPAARSNLAMAFDEARGEIVLFGGRSETELFSDTWLWDGETWQMATPDQSPPPRCCHALAYDAARESIILYGGWNNKTDSFYNDTWEWDGVTWTELSCCNSPDASGHALAPLSGNGDLFALLTFDGQNGYIWQDGVWRNLQTNGPMGRADARLAYDSDQSRLVLFGGIKDGEILNDLWVFADERWQYIEIAGVPEPRYANVFFYDEAQKAFVIFGGSTADGRVNETWLLRLPEDLSDYIANPPPFGEQSWQQRPEVGIALNSSP